MCVFEVCVSLPPSCSAELPLIFGPSLSPPSPPSLLLFSASSLCLYPSRILSPFSPLLFFPLCLFLLITSFPISSFHLFFLSCPSSSSQSPSSLLFPITFISSHRLSFPLFFPSCLILSPEQSLFPCSLALTNLFCSSSQIQ